MKKKYSTEKTDTFTAYDSENQEYVINEFTYYEHSTIEQKVKKTAVVRNYKTDAGIHVKKDNATQYIILSNYGKKNIIVNKVPTPV
jgi:hypothetical protein